MNDRSGFLRPPSPSRVGVLLQVSGDPVYGEGKGPFRNPGEAYSKVPGLTGVAVPARREEDLGVLGQTSPKPLLLLPSAVVARPRIQEVDDGDGDGDGVSQRESRRMGGRLSFSAHLSRRNFLMSIQQNIPADAGRKGILAAFSLDSSTL